MADARTRPKKGRGAGQTIGGILVGFDEQVWRQRPPARELVVTVDRLGTVTTPSGLMIDLPDEDVVDDPPGAADRRADDTVAEPR